MNKANTFEHGWIATDLDGTLFGRKATPGAVPATWKTAGEGAAPEP